MEKIINFNEAVLMKAGLLYDDGDIEEDGVMDFAVFTFSHLINDIKTGKLTVKQAKDFFSKSQAKNDWTGFYFHLDKFFKAHNDRDYSIDLAIISHPLAFHVYCHYFLEMMDCLDELLHNSNQMVQV